MCNCFSLICCILVLTKEIRRIVNEPKTFCERYGLRLFCRVYRIGDRQQFCSAAFLDLSVLVRDQSGENRTFDNAQFRNTASCGRGFRRFCRSDRLPCVHCDCTCDGGCRDRYDGGASGNHAAFCRTSGGLRDPAAWNDRLRTLRFFGRRSLARLFLNSGKSASCGGHGHVRDAGACGRRRMRCRPDLCRDACGRIR